MMADKDGQQWTEAQQQQQQTQQMAASAIVHGKTPTQIRRLNNNIRISSPSDNLSPLSQKLMASDRVKGVQPRSLRAFFSEKKQPASAHRMACFVENGDGDGDEDDDDDDGDGDGNVYADVAERKEKATARTPASKHNAATARLDDAMDTEQPTLPTRWAAGGGGLAP